MVKEKRHRELLTYLEEVEIASTQDLVAALGASAATIRRDLDDLEERELVTRVFGGAKLRTPPHDPERVDEPFDAVARRNPEHKQTIATLALERINEGDTIFLESGTSAYALARALDDLALTVVTNSLRIVDHLASLKRIDVVVLGGSLNGEYLCTQGADTVTQLESLAIDTAFLGCSGVSAKGMVRDTDPLERDIKLAALESSGSTLLLADSSKFPGTGAYPCFELAACEALLTNGPLPIEVAPLDTEVIHP